METELETVQLDVRDRVAYVRLNRPEQRNTVTAELMQDVYDALGMLADRADVSIVVLTGNGPTFSPGADLQREPGQAPALPSRDAYTCAALLHEMPQITVAAVNGGCAGAGFALASACDLRVASDAARFSVAFIDVGVSGEMGTAWTLSRIVGPARARELYLIPRKFTAEEALELGFVSRVFAADSFQPSMAKFAEELAGHDPAVLRDIKANLIDADRLPLRDFIEVETQRHLSRFSADAASETFARFTRRAEEISGPS
jgi:2-(1,2-epoxy-1,2-dihydrophenyl)acetyl-CoA isomerase